MEIKIHPVRWNVIPHWRTYYADLFLRDRQHYVICDVARSYGYLLGEITPDLYTVSSTPDEETPPLLVSGVPIVNDDSLTLLAFVLENLNIESVRTVRQIVTLERIAAETARPPEPVPPSLRCEFEIKP